MVRQVIMQFTRATADVKMIAPKTFKKFLVDRGWTTTAPEIVEQVLNGEPYKTELYVFDIEREDED